MSDHWVRHTLGRRITQSGILANRPLPAIADRYYWATDISTMFRDTGVTWEVVGSHFLRYFTNQNLGTNLNSGTMAATNGDVFLSRLDIPFTMTIDRIAYPMGLSAVGNVRLGIYRQGPVLDLPDAGALVAQTALVPQATPFELQFIPIAPTRLTLGAYWGAITGDTFGWTRSTMMVESSLETRYYLSGVPGALTNPCPITVLEQNCNAFFLRVTSIP